MAITEPYTLNAVTVGTTELSIVSGTTTLQNVASAAVYQLWLDAGNMLKGDEFRVRLYEKVLAGSTKKVSSQWSLMGLQAELLITPTFMKMHGWDMTIQH